MNDQMTMKPTTPNMNPNIICQPCSTKKPNIRLGCPSCGGTDHQRKSSKKCPNFVPRASKKHKKNKVSSIDDAVVAVNYNNVSVAEKGEIVKPLDVSE